MGQKKSRHKLLVQHLQKKYVGFVHPDGFKIVGLSEEVCTSYFTFTVYVSLHINVEDYWSQSFHYVQRIGRMYSISVVRKLVE